MASSRLPSAIRVVVVTASGDDGPSDEDLRELEGFPVIDEGGVCQGKTSLARSMKGYLEKRGFRVACYPEPTDTEALAEFMRYQAPPPEFAAEDAARHLEDALGHLPPPSTGAQSVTRSLVADSIMLVRACWNVNDSALTERQRFEAGRRAAAVRMQTSMMDRRTAVVRQAALDCSRGAVAIVDRGPFGDTTFMTSTYLDYGVAKGSWNEYIVGFLSRYLSIDFPLKTFLILRLDAPVSVTYSRYLARERDTPGNRYTQEYMQAIEDAHDSCTGAWGRYVVYDNSGVPYHRSTSPGVDGCPDEAAVRAVLRSLCQLAREKRAELGISKK